MRRFDEFRDSLGIAPTMLTKRLNTLVESGLLARRRYSEHPPRDEYVLTDMGQDFRPVLLAMMAFGNRHFPPDRQMVRVVNEQTGEAVDPILVDPATGRRVDGPGYAVVTTPMESGA
jgi:DNA-binding HxlR family transcriptional regulator